MAADHRQFGIPPPRRPPGPITGMWDFRVPNCVRARKPFAIMAGCGFSPRMKILVVGKGGREHALVRALADAPGNSALFCFPGSDAIGALAGIIAVDGMDGLLEWIDRERPDLVVAGEEAWLVKDEGLANACERMGVPCWGPHKTPT